MSKFVQLNDDNTVFSFYDDAINGDIPSNAIAIDDNTHSDYFASTYHKKVYTNGRWAEGKTDDEFVEDAFLSSLQPSQKDIEKAERQVETVELLIELGVI